MMNRLLKGFPLFLSLILTGPSVKAGTGEVSAPLEENHAALQDNPPLTESWAMTLEKKMPAQGAEGLPVDSDLDKGGGSFDVSKPLLEVKEEEPEPFLEIEERPKARGRFHALTDFAQKGGDWIAQGATAAGHFIQDKARQGAAYVGSGRLEEDLEEGWKHAKEGWDYVKSGLEQAGKVARKGWNSAQRGAHYLNDKRKEWFSSRRPSEDSSKQETEREDYFTMTWSGE